MHEEQEEQFEGLRNPDSLIRRTSIEAFWDAGETTESLVAISALLCDPDRSVREIAARVMEAWSGPHAAARTAAFIANGNIGVRNLAGDTLVKMGTPAVLALFPYITANDKDIRKFAIDVLALIPNETMQSQVACNAIAARLKDRDENVVVAVLDALGAINVADQYSDTLLELYNTAPYARPSVLEALAGYPDILQLSFFERALSDEDLVVQMTCVEALAGRPSPETLNLLFDKVHQVAESARPVVLNAIIEMIQTPACEGIAIPDSLRDYFVEMLDDFSIDYVRSAVHGLSSFADENVTSTLLKTIGKDQDLDMDIFRIVISSGPSIIQRLVQLIRDSAVTVKAGGTFLAGFVGQFATTNTDFMQSIEAGMAFDLAGEQFHDFDTETRSAWLHFSSMHESKASPIIREGLRDADVDVRLSAVELVKQIDYAPYLEILVSMKDDEDQFIRNIVLELLPEQSAT